jgi:hypothetical protein
LYQAHREKGIAMEMLIVAAVVVVAVGALATFVITELLLPDLLLEAEEHGRFAHHGEQGVPMGNKVSQRKGDC